MRLPWRKRERSEAEVMASIRREFAWWGWPLDGFTDEDIARANLFAGQAANHATATADEFMKAMIAITVSDTPSDRG